MKSRHPDDELLNAIQMTRGVVVVLGFLGFFLKRGDSIFSSLSGNTHSAHKGKKELVPVHLSDSLNTSFT